MATPTNRKRAEILGLAVSHLTLRHFTPESVNEFLTALASRMEEDIIPKAGPSPWLPNLHPDHKGSLTAPSGDSRGPYTFAALTHMQVIRALVAADPGNLADISSVMKVAAHSDNQALRLSMLRIGLRFNHAMFLKLRSGKDAPTVDSLLVNEPDAPGIPQFERNQPLPASRVECGEGAVFVVDSDGNRVAAGRPTPVVAVGHTPEPTPAVIPEPTPVKPAVHTPPQVDAAPSYPIPEPITDAQETPQPALENAPTPVVEPAVEPTPPKPAEPTPVATAEPIKEDSNLSPSAVAVAVKSEDEDSPF